MDVLIMVHLTDSAGLEHYLKHPLHLKFIEETCEHVAQKVSFDWEEEKLTMINGILLNEADNVVTVTQEVPKGDTVFYQDGSILRDTQAVETIPEFHKIAVRNIPKGADVVKYGERIGYASKDIVQGQHVHTQNVSEHQE